MLKEYKQRWKDKTGEPMPEAIAKMPLDVIERKLRLVESMDGVFVVPPQLTPVISDAGDSMADWDSHKEF